MVSPRARSEWRVWRERWDRCCRRSAEEKEEEEEEEGPARDSESDAELGGEGHGHGHEEVSVLLAPRASSGSDGDADGGPGYGDARETLRARQDTVGAVVLVGGTADDVHRQQVAAGVSRCVCPAVCCYSISPLFHLPCFRPSSPLYIFTTPR